MEKNIEYDSVLGIDISKDYFDAFLSTSEAVTRQRFENTAAGFKQVDRWLQKCNAGRVFAGLEATGTYGVRLLQHLHENH